ncbi:MAG: hypothetical protein CMI54_08195 [Parcubacteria group bacterium]|nr:hypothetical protein [Parcubacteria group bacterium]|tara:strand:- start:1570 stop:2544 length:975 start_codon:yes stop_codon:yes gene_type:complete
MANGGVIGPVNDPTSSSTPVAAKTTTFTADGTFARQEGSPSSVHMLVVGAGGGAGQYCGGAGAGGMVEAPAYDFGTATGPFAVTVGAGGVGTGLGAAGSTARKGEDSVFTNPAPGPTYGTVTGLAGGAVGPSCNYNLPAEPTHWCLDMAGGSGAASGTYYSTTGPSTQGNSGGGTGYGNHAGDGSRPSGTDRGGGGGGAGAVGGTSPGNSDGGAGRASTASGGSVTYAGGGAGWNNTRTNAGGSGGGGGAQGNPPYDGTDGLGGGAGAGVDTSGAGTGTGSRTGGDGIVIIAEAAGDIVTYAATGVWQMQEVLKARTEGTWPGQ